MPRSRLARRLTSTKRTSRRTCCDVLTPIAFVTALSGANCLAIATALVTLGASTASPLSMILPLTELAFICELGTSSRSCLSSSVIS